MIRCVVLSLIVTLAALFSTGKVHSQVIMNRPGADTMKVVNLIHADRLSYKASKRLHYRAANAGR